jgi:hypothetical protein
MRRCSYLLLILGLMAMGVSSDAPSVRQRYEAPVLHTSWDDLLEGVETIADWRQHLEVLRARYLALLRDHAKPEKPPLELQVHDSVVVDSFYTRKLISYYMERDERAHAFRQRP